MTQRWLTRIETSGNQRYVFASNKLREQLGGSWHISQIGFLTREHSGPRDTVLQAGSGVGLVLCASQEAASNLIRQVTTWAITNAPGLTVNAAVTLVDLDTEYLTDALGRNYATLQANANNNGGPQRRFQRLPIVADCATTGAPAARAHHGVAQSYAAWSKSAAAPRAVNDLHKIDKRLVRNLNELEKTADLLEAELEATVARHEAELGSCRWLAVVHADGNAVGAMFSEIGKNAGQAGRSHREANDEFIRDFTAASKALDSVTHNALRQAIDETFGKGVSPIVPLVLGGDDLTVVMDASRAREFTVHYIEAFGSEAAKHDVLKRASEKVTASAGIAIVKPHFPFSTAYELCEDLTASAKTRKKDGPGYDIHVLRDTANVSLGAIRRRLTSTESSPPLTTNVRLFGGPYLLGDGEGHEKLEAWKQLCSGLPSSQAHRLREAAHRSTHEAEQLLDVLRQRHAEIGDRKVFDMTDPDEGKLTMLLDAMEVADVERAGSGKSETDQTDTEAAA